MKQSPFIPDYKDLPGSIPLFPLSGAVLLPGGRLPLNIFEPRYLNMTRDALKGVQLIGMIQPQGSAEEPLYAVGCAGYLSRYAETSDGRIEIMLEGVCRFQLLDKTMTGGGYYLGHVDWHEYADDYEPAGEISESRAEAFHQQLGAYLERNQMEADWELLRQMEIVDLSNTLVSMLPLTVKDKQALLEAASAESMLDALIAMLRSEPEMGAARH